LGNYELESSLDNLPGIEAAGDARSVFKRFGIFQKFHELFELF
jgi:hypothetical protein